MVDSKSTCNNSVIRSGTSRPIQAEGLTESSQWSPQRGDHRVAKKAEAPWRGGCQKPYAFSATPPGSVALARYPGVSLRSTPGYSLATLRVAHHSNPPCSMPRDPLKGPNPRQLVELRRRGYSFSTNALNSRWYTWITSLCRNRSRWARCGQIRVCLSADRRGDSSLPLRMTKVKVPAWRTHQCLRLITGYLAADSAPPNGPHERQPAKPIRPIR